MSVYLHRDQIKVGVLVKSRWTVHRPPAGVSVILSEPFENTVKLFSPSGEIEYHNANYLIPVKDEKSS